ncbi:MAG: hypothetical protein DMG65_10765 [Candidatus Angelobacter sp. Gp1-AA117]|nr:MAG: hypothetical protein DMG65_10765 [Candidatus Angelobacter sp. Gp1-AA117]
MELQPIQTEQRPGFFQTVFLNERGLRAGWRLLVFFAMLIALQQIAGLIAKLFVHPASTSPTPSRGISPTVALPEMVAFGFLLLASWMMSRIEKRDIGQYGLPLKSSGFLSQFAFGYLFWGFLPLALLLCVMRVLHVFYFGHLALHQAQILYWGFTWWGVFLLVGLLEEYLLRGYLLYTLADGIGFWPAAIVLAALFALGHSRNSGETRIGVIMTALFAIFASVTLWRTGNLWLAVGAHAGWDWGESFFFGTNDSGLPAQGHLLNSHIAGPDWLSGGTVGPEGSLLTLILMLVMTMLAYFLLRRPSRKPALMITTR